MVNPRDVSFKTQAGSVRREASRALLSQATMLFSLAALSLVLAGGIKESLDQFREAGPGVGGDVGASLVALGAAYLFGWILALASVRAYGNLLLPVLLRVYVWILLVGVAVLYVGVIFKLFRQPQNVSRFPLYLALLLAGIAALLGLHLIGVLDDLRPCSVPLLLAGLFHLSMLVVRYVFLPGARPGYLAWDLLFLTGMLAVAGVLLAFPGFLNAPRRAVDRLCARLARPPE